MKRQRNIKCEVGCVICSRHAVYHHVKSFGSGGLTVEHNLLALCPAHHNEVHSKGLAFFAGKYHDVYRWLLLNGWEYDEFLMKWMRY